MKAAPCWPLGITSGTNAAPGGLFGAVQKPFRSSLRLLGRRWASTPNSSPPPTPHRCRAGGGAASLWPLTCRAPRGGGPGQALSEDERCPFQSKEEGGGRFVLLSGNARGKMVLKVTASEVAWDNAEGSQAQNAGGVPSFAMATEGGLIERLASPRLGPPGRSGHAEGLCSRPGRAVKPLCWLAGGLPP